MRKEFCLRTVRILPDFGGGAGSMARVLAMQAWGLGFKLCANFCPCCCGQETAGVCLLPACPGSVRDCPKGLRQWVWQSRIPMSSSFGYSVYTCCKQHTPATQTWIEYTQVWKVFQSSVFSPTYCFCSEVLLVYCKAPLLKCEHK